MEEINTEIFISSLIIMGYKEIDITLYSFMFSQLINSESFFKKFKIINSEPKQVFNTYVEKEGTTYRLREEYDLDTNVSVVSGCYLPLSNMLNYSEELINYIYKLGLNEYMPIKGHNK